MRLPLLVLGWLVLASTAPAGRCGDDVDGRPVPCDCGDVLVGSRTLGDADRITGRVCPGTGLLVAVPADHPAATLSLGGHVIAGSRRGVGIQVRSGGAGGLTILGPGAMRGFDAGILAPTGALARVANVVATDNVSDGFTVAGDGAVIEGCEATRNGRDGFVVRGHGYRLDGNRALANGRHGFSVAGRDGAVSGPAGNEAAANGRDGLRVRGRGLDVEHTVVTANGARGIRARKQRNGRENPATDCWADGSCS